MWISPRPADLICVLLPQSQSGDYSLSATLNLPYILSGLCDFKRLLSHGGVNKTRGAGCFLFEFPQTQSFLIRRGSREGGNYCSCLWERFQTCWSHVWIILLWFPRNISETLPTWQRSELNVITWTERPQQQKVKFTERLDTRTVISYAQGKIMFTQHCEWANFKLVIKYSNLEVHFPAFSDAFDHILWPSSPNVFAARCMDEILNIHQNTNIQYMSK